MSSLFCFLHVHIRLMVPSDSSYVDTLCGGSLPSRRPLLVGRLVLFHCGGPKVVSVDVVS